MLLDERKDGVRGAAGERDHTLSRVATIDCENLVGVLLQPRIDLSAVEPGCRASRFSRVEHSDRCAAFREVKRSGESGIAGADDRNVRAARLLERRRGWRGRGCRGP